MILELKKGLTYGPVRSRRLGASLGINLFPGDEKLCPFDCVYCQYGRTLRPVVHLARDQVRLPAPGEVETALERALESLPALPAYITFSGNGEPTLHPDFPEMVNRVISLRNRFGGGMRTAVLSNSARVGNPEVRAALVRLDVSIMKLDCGTEDTFSRYNRPGPGLNLEGIEEGLRMLSREVPITVQSLFAAGRDGNMNEADTAGWIERLVRIKPAAVQLYTLARGHADYDLRPGPRADLLRMAEEAGNRGVSVSVFS